MATIDDINQQKKIAVGILDQKIYDAIAQKNTVGLSDAESDQIDQVVHDLMTQRAQVFQQAYTAAAESAAMANALQALTAAADELKRVAERMTSLTEYVSNLATLGTATGKIVAALKG